MNIVIIGGGKVGYYLSKTLLEHGHYPTIIEQSKETCNFIANDLDIPIICGDGTTIETLETANIQECDALISVTGKDENNLISCQLAKKLFNIPKTIAKVNNPKNAQVVKELGVDIVVNSTNNITHLLEREVDTSTIKELVTINHGEATICEITLPENYRLHGKKLKELKLPNECVVISINRNDTLIIPRGDTELLSNDVVMLLAKTDSIHDIKLLLKINN